MLGLLPGAGGTQRLPKLIGLPQVCNPFFSFLILLHFTFALKNTTTHPYYDLLTLTSQSFEMMLTGKNIVASKAKKMGLVDLVVDPFALEKSAIATALEMVEKRKPMKKKDLQTRIMEFPLIRNSVFKQGD
jgi:enoyl-CoA hydratase/carnithine racemase